MQQKYLIRESTRYFHFRFRINCHKEASKFHTFYAALLPRRGSHIASHSVCPSDRLSVRLSVRPVSERHVAPPSELQWHTCIFRHALTASVLFVTHWGPHIVRPSRPHKFLFLLCLPTIDHSDSRFESIHRFILTNRFESIRFVKKIDSLVVLQFFLLIYCSLNICS